VTSTHPAPTAASSPADASWLLDRTEALCRADTSTGREDHGLPALRTALRELGAAIELQEVAPGRHNVLATWGTPRLLFTTHLDTVPPFVPPRRQGDLLLGRGACDAKGQVAVQLGAVRELLAAGHRGFAWLGLVGEETDSAGAIAAADLAPHFESCVAAICGGPTGNLLATGQRGAVQLRLRTRGRAAHSGTPELGQSAIWPLLDWLQRLRGLPLLDDADLGPEVWNLAGVTGGGPPNVVPAHAEAMLLLRSLPGSRFVAQARELAPPDGSLDEVAATPPAHFTTLPDLPHATIGFASDAPAVRDLVPSRSVLLCGPGDVRTAHTLDERITGSELLAGQAMLVRIARRLLAVT
jgi:acetylornithine deacetylase